MLCFFLLLRLGSAISGGDGVVQRGQDLCKRGEMDDDDDIEFDLFRRAANVVSWRNRETSYTEVLSIEILQDVGEANS
jgi:hypothetical protein